MIRKGSNKFPSFCVDNRLRQMAIFTSLSEWGKDLPDSFSIKTNKMLYDMSLYHIKRIDSMLPCVCSVIGTYRFKDEDENDEDEI